MALTTNAEHGARPSKRILLAVSATLGAVFTASALYSFTNVVVYNLLFQSVGAPAIELALILLPFVVVAGGGLRWLARRYRTPAVRIGALVGGAITAALELVGLWLDFSGRPDALTQFALPALLGPLLLLAAARLAAIPPRDDIEDPGASPLNIFFSYDSDDGSLVTWIKDGIENRTDRAVEVYIYEDHPRPGTSISTQAKNQIRAADLLLVLITPNSQDSPWVQQEVGYADGVGCEVVPVVVEGSNAPEILGDVEYLTFDREHPDDFFENFLTYVESRWSAEQNNGG